MSSKSPLLRIRFILSKIKPEKAISYTELVHAYQREMEPKFLDGLLATDTFTKRTFQRDIRYLREFFQTEILYDRNTQGYRLADNSHHAMHLKNMLDTLSLHKLLQLKPVAAPVLFPDERKTSGPDWMYLLLHTITHQLKTELTYQKFDGDPPFTRVVNPLALKEFKNRWYLLAFQDGKPVVKTYSLDRILKLNPGNRRFEPGDAENWRPKFDCVFGITSGVPDKKEDIVLSFRPQQGRYVQALPLHSSQETIFENETEIRIRLCLYVTHDFRMELLSYGPEVEVLEPENLREDLAEMLEEGFRKYSKAEAG